MGIKGKHEATLKKLGYQTGPVLGTMGFRPRFTPIVKKRAEDTHSFENAPNLSSKKTLVPATHHPCSDVLDNPSP